MAKVTHAITRESGVIELVHGLLEDAARAGVSDIHLEPGSKMLAVRLRRDGLLTDVSPIAKEIHAEVITRLKVLAGLRTDEHHVAQDGRFRFSTSEENECDVRLSIIPTYFGEKAVLRLLSRVHLGSTFGDLGCTEEQQGHLTRALDQPHGLILVTGPTGSGKTTTLYALLEKLALRTRSVVTLEDPIEYSLEGITQIPANQHIGLSFADGLRSVLRQDPDVIMVGEIRDTETARLAVTAALTGHLVLATLHTNDAVTALPRLVDMGVEPYLLAATARLVISQRLVRRICETCRTVDVTMASALAPGLFFRGRGCDECGCEGYKGRVGVFEFLPITREVQELFLTDDSGELLQLATKESLCDAAIEKAHAGTTTLDEVYRIGYD